MGERKLALRGGSVDKLAASLEGLRLCVASLGGTKGKAVCNECRERPRPFGCISGIGETGALLDVDDFPTDRHRYELLASITTVRRK
jgi:hypothetical protein